MDEFSKYLFAVPQRQTDSPLTSLPETPIETSDKSIDNACTFNDEKNVFDPKTDVSSLERKLETIEKKLLERSIQINLLAAKCKKEIDLLKIIEEASVKISHLRNNFQELGEKLSRNTLPSEVLYNTSQQYPVLETNCMRNVREICEELTSFHYEEFVSLVELDNEQKHSYLTKEKLNEKLKALLESFPSEEIFHSLLHNIKDSSANLKDITSRINLQNDAESLRFKFEQDRINDLSNKSAMFQTVPQLVEECQKQHFQRFLLSEKSKNDSWKLKKKLKDLNHDINVILNRECDNDEFKSYRLLFDLQQAINGLSATSKLLETEYSNLEREKSRKEESMIELTRKYQSIQNFENVMRAKQKIIQKLIKENSSAKSLQMLQVENVSKYTNTKLISMDKEIDTICLKYKRLIDKEIERFMNVPLSNLLTVNTGSENKQLVKDFSIYRLSSNQPGSQSLGTISSAYDSLPCVTSENLLENVKNGYRKIFEKEISCEQSSGTSEQLDNTFGMVNRYLENVKSKESNQKENALPSLKRSKVLASSVMKESVKFQNAAKLWWDAPGQHVVPWIMEDGLSLHEYQNNFNHIANKIKASQY